nr:tyrosine-protein phosphatase 3 [Leptinotarsa decemlineata]
MGVTLQLILGVFLILEICRITGNNTIQQNIPLDTVDTNINLIEKLPKTDAELNIANKDTQKRINHDSKLDNSHSISNIIDQEENHTTKSQSNSNIEVDKANRDNSIKQDSNEKNRENDSRSINIQKYVSSEFQNNVYSLPIIYDDNKHLDESYLKSSTRKFVDFENFELSTPKTEFFDKKFNEAKQKLEQEYESNGFEDFHHDNDHHNIHEDFEDMDDQNEGDLHLRQLFGDPTTSLDYKEQMNVSKNNTIDKNSKHDDLLIERMKKINFISTYSSTSTYRYDFKEDTLQPETSSPKTSFETTGKSTTLTKPPTNNNSYILSNKIESETIKAIHPFSENSTKSYRNENDLVPKKQTAEENKISNTITTNREDTTTENIPTKSITVTSRNEVALGVEESSSEEYSTQKDEFTTIKKIEITPTANIDTTVMSEKSTTSSEIYTTTSDKLSTTTEEPTTLVETDISVTDSEETTIDSDEKATSTSETNISNQETTTSTPETTISNQETTTFNPETTEEMTSTTLDTQSSEITVSHKESTNEALDSTSGYTTVISTTQQITLSPITNYLKDQTTLAEIVTTNTDDTEINSSSLRISKGVIITESTSEVIDTTTEMFTSTDIIKTSFIPPNLVTTTTETPTTLVPLIMNVSHSSEDTTTLDTTVTTIEFVHVETRDNHTTLLPETLSPNFSYPVPHGNNSRSMNDSGSSEQTTIETTTEEEITETSASTEHATIDNSEDNSGKIAAIVISTVGALCLVLLAGLLYLMRKRQKRFNYKQRCRPINLDDYSVDNLSVYNSLRRKADRQSKRSYGNPAFEDPVAVTHPLNFPALAKFAANTEDIKAEFEEIPQITAKTSELPEGCEPKNRYANVIPLPETRVFLKTIDGYPNSDYINANYVTGPKNTKGYYIACQAPLQDTVDDFWRMMWEQQSKVILMITHFFENGMEKCFDYLPPSEILDCNRLFGDFQVTLKKRDVKDKYIISSLQLKVVYKLKFDFVMTLRLICLLVNQIFSSNHSTFQNVVINGNMNGSAINEVNPVVVHCSPGTGRTGVVIACDIAIREFEQTRLVDIPRIVYRIRRDRASAVQTKEQYMFIYKVVSLYATKLSGGGFESF